MRTVSTCGGGRAFSVCPSDQGRLGGGGGNNISGCITAPNAWLNTTLPQIVIRTTVARGTQSIFELPFCLIFSHLFSFSNRQHRHFTEVCLLHDVLEQEYGGSLWRGTAGKKNKELQSRHGKRVDFSGGARSLWSSYGETG